MTLADRIFSKTATGEKLIHDYHQNRISHAYMLIGDKGSGKMTLAKAFSKLLLCEDPHGDECCNECQGCRYFESFGEHPNLTVLRLTDKATIGVKEIRDMTDGVFSAPYIGKRKIYLITDAEKLSPQAQNALLKILEEPPEYVVFLILTASRYAMLTTVLSRCRIINMAPYKSDAMMDILDEKKPELSTAEKDVLLHRAQGNPGKLLCLLESEEEQRQAVIASANAILCNDIETILDSVKDIDSREKAISFCRILNELMRDALILMSGGSKSCLFDPDETDLYEKINEKASLKKLTSYITEINETIKMLSGNVTYQLCVKNLLMKW